MASLQCGLGEFDIVHARASRATRVTLSIDGVSKTLKSISPLCLQVASAFGQLPPPFAFLRPKIRLDRF